MAQDSPTATETPSPPQAAQPCCRFGAASGLIVGVVAVAVAVAALLLCPHGPTLKEVVDSPERYEGRLVTVGGTVGSPGSLPRLGGGYQLRDETGTKLLVIAREVPAEGSTTRVKGTVKVVDVLGRKFVYLHAGAGKEPQ
ncbi:MAG: hypothetical protein HYU66_00445 [Armatimonadetes bacterium]|nr:hypothetical protein [Armatimonadota bacterium]